MTQPNAKLRRKILLSPSAYYPSLGGVEEICRNLAACLIESGFEVKIVTHRHPDNLPEQESFNGVEVHRLPFYYPSRSFANLIKSWICIDGLLKYVSLLRDWRPDLVHIVCPSSNALYTWAACRLSGIPVLVTFQGELFMDANQIYDRSAL